MDLLAECSIDGSRRDRESESSDKPVRSVTVCRTEAPLGWLVSRGHQTRRQFDAGERLRSDWERAQLAWRVTMGWDAAAAGRPRSRLICWHSNRRQEPVPRHSERGW